MIRTGVMTMTIPSIIGRLLEELSWTGKQIVSYRGGGRGFENVLSTEVLQALYFLPRSAFLARVVRAFRGGSPATHTEFQAEAEQADFVVLPGGGMYLHGDNIPKVEVQPDAIITTPSVYCLVEAKRIRSSSFQRRQLAREFLMAHQFAAKRRPMLALLLSSPPPVRVQGRGRLSIRDAIATALPEVFSPGSDLTTWESRIEETVVWLTWAELAEQIRLAQASFTSGNPSVDAAIERITSSLLKSIQWHDEVA
jgi:hypothetical protein